MNDEWELLKQRVREASDIVDVVGGYIPLRQAGPTYKGLCPFHEDNRPSFDVDPRRQRYRCWACNKVGDVFSFVMERERVGFQEAMELLARRAGISLEKIRKEPTGPSRAVMFDVMKWAQEQFQQALLESPLPEAETARKYLGERGLVGETVRAFGLGYAPPMGEWLTAKAVNQGFSTEVLERVGLIAKRNEGRGYYDRFRDRVIFPIRDLRSQVVGFGGRVLPSSPLAATAPKYYNSAETPIFAKSQLLYGLDLALQPATKAGAIAVVEGYMDVIMARQHGIANVVAPMGTALTSQHLRKLRGVTSRVVLVFDADAGGSTGVDRALELFVQSEADLRIGILPEGKDPCDLVLARGGPAFQKVLDDAIDVFEFKLRQVWPGDTNATLEAKRAAVEKMLALLAAAPELGGVKMELMINRIAHRVGLKEETLWTRLRELHGQRARRAEARAEGRPEPRTDGDASPAAVEPKAAPEPKSAPAVRHEVELVELLLADPNLVCRAMQDLPAATIEHAGLRRLIDGLYALQAEGRTPDLDHLRERLDNERLTEHAIRMQERGQVHADRAQAYAKVLARFRETSRRRQQQALKNQVESVGDHDAAIALLQTLKQTRNATPSSAGTTPAGSS